VFGEEAEEAAADQARGAAVSLHVVRVAVLLLWCVPSIAAADALPGPRSDCPRGSVGTPPTSHAETSQCVVARSCAGDAECGAGYTCERTALCVAGTQVSGACDAQGRCSEGTCSRARRCVGGPFGAAPRVPSAAPATLALAGAIALGWKRTGRTRRARS
jgi:hypothetical protein